MLFEVVYNICFNICLLVVLAFVLTRMDFMQRLLLNDGEPEGGHRVCRAKEKVILGIIFGGFCMISDMIGLQVTGALPNARVIGILSSGFLGGPVSCAITTVIAARSPVYGFPGADLHGGLRDLRGAPRMHRLVDWLQKEKRQAVFQLFSSGSHIPLGADSYCDDPSAHQAVHRGDGHCKDRHCSDGDYQFRGYGDLFQCI